MYTQPEPCLIYDYNNKITLKSSHLYIQQIKYETYYE